MYLISNSESYIHKFSRKCNNSMKKRSQQPKTDTCTDILLLVKMLQFTADYNDSNALCIFFLANRLWNTGPCC